MRTLSFLGSHEDGKHLTLNDEDGNRYLLPLSEEIQAAVLKEQQVSFTDVSGSNNSSALTNQLKTYDTANTPTTSLRPKAIQELLRSGLTAQEVAAEHNLDLTRVRIYESPVIAEREYVRAQAQSFLVGGEGSPCLEEVVIDRIALKQVSPENIHWQAKRPIGEDWQLHVSFSLDGQDFCAIWKVEIDNKLLVALNELAKQITETDTQNQGAYHEILDLTNEQVTRLDARRSQTPDIPQSSESTVESVLSELEKWRGKRRPVLVDFDTEDEDVLVENPISPTHSTGSDRFTEQNTVLNSENASSATDRNEKAENTADTAPIEIFPRVNPDVNQLLADAGQKAPSSSPATDSANHPVVPSSEPETASKLPETPSQSLTPESETKPDTVQATDPCPGLDPKPNLKPKAKKQRRSVPSWDEIVFGTKSED